MARRTKNQAKRNGGKGGLPGWMLLLGGLVGGLVIAAVLIMLWLLQHHAAAKVSSLFFLTPALSTIEGAILFDETLGALAVVGLVAALVGVSLTLRTPTVPPSD